MMICQNLLVDNRVTPKDLTCDSIGNTLLHFQSTRMCQNTFTSRINGIIIKFDSGESVLFSASFNI